MTGTLSMVKHEGSIKSSLKYLHFVGTFGGLEFQVEIINFLQLLFIEELFSVHKHRGNRKNY